MDSYQTTRRVERKRGEVTRDMLATFSKQLSPKSRKVLVNAFGGTRTYHRLACAIEDAGFEIRDQIGWVYGSGFPKSHDVSKGIDRVGGMPPDEQAALLRQRRESAGLSREELAALIGCTVSSVRDWEEGRARSSGGAVEHITPSKAYRALLAERLGYSVDERRLVGVAIDRRGDGTVYGVGHTGNLTTGGHTDLSRDWEGWGTALKPAWEPIVMARKPLDGTVAANVLEHGTGAINIDGCRIEGEARPFGNGSEGSGGYRLHKRDVSEWEPSEQGRWPANIIHDGSDEVVAAFPDAPGQQQDIDGNAPSSKTGSIYGKMNREGEASAARRYTDEGATNFAALPGQRRGDSGSAARFFYTAKADADDRLGSKHPTVKPLDLMQYLVRLVTPPGGLVLDPFAGTGTTGEAAWREGMRAVLIEREEEYQADIERRMDLAQNPTRRAAVAKSKNNLQGAEGTPLFTSDGGAAA